MLRYEFAKELDDPQTTIDHRDIILSKRFLKRIYEEYYALFKNYVNQSPNGKYLEIGSGGGFIKDVIPGVITSDILPLSGIVDKVFSAETLPFKDTELDGIFMINVLHHIPHPHRFFKEAERTLKPGGKIIMVEPATTPLSKFIYTNFHHEPFVPGGGWEIDSTGPLSGANGAIPWIYMVRDAKKFSESFPSLRIESITPHTAFRYTVSGGVSRNLLVPEWSYGLWKVLERLPGVNRTCGMLATYVVSKKN